MMNSDNDDNDYNNEYKIGNKNNNNNNKTQKKKSKTPPNTASWNIPSRFPLRQSTTTAYNDEYDDKDNMKDGRIIISRALPLTKCRPDEGSGVTKCHPLEIMTTTIMTDPSLETTVSLPLTKNTTTSTTVLKVSENDDNNEQQKQKEEDDDDDEVQRHQRPESSIDCFIKRMDENASDDDDDDEQLLTNQRNFNDPLSPLLYTPAPPPPPPSLTPPPPSLPSQKTTHPIPPPPRRPRLTLPSYYSHQQHPPFTLQPPLLTLLPQLRSDMYTSFIDHEDRSYTVKTLIKATSLLSSRDYLCLSFGNVVWNEATRLLSEGGDLVTSRLEELERRGGCSSGVGKIVRGGWRVHHLGEEFDVTYTGEGAEDGGDDDEGSVADDDEADDLGVDGSSTTAMRYQWAMIRESFIQRDEDDGNNNGSSSWAWEASVNWSLKILSLPDLIPRLYIDMALLKRYFFLGMEEEEEEQQQQQHSSNHPYYRGRHFNNVVKRIGGSLCGISCDVVQVYAMAYLVSCAQEALDYFKKCLRERRMKDARRKLNDKKKKTNLLNEKRIHPLLTCQHPFNGESSLVDNNNEWYTVHLLKTYLRSFPSVRNFDVSSYLHDNSICLEDYLLHHHVPPLSLICHAALSSSDEDDDDDDVEYECRVDDILNCYREHCRSIVVLHVIFRHVAAAVSSSSSSNVLMNRREEWMTLVKEASVDGTTTTTTTATESRKNSWGREHLAVLEMLARIWKRKSDDNGVVVRKWGKEVFDMMEMACGPDNDHFVDFLKCMDAWLKLSLGVMEEEKEVERVIDNCLSRIIRWYHKSSASGNVVTKATMDVVKQISCIINTLFRQCRLYIHDQIKSVNSPSSQTTTYITESTALLILSKKYPQRFMANIISSYPERTMMSLRPILKSFAMYHYHKQQQQQLKSSRDDDDDDGSSHDNHTTANNDSKMMNLIRDTLFQSLKMIHDSLILPSSDEKQKQKQELTPQQQVQHLKRTILLSTLITTYLLNPLAAAQSSTLRPSIELLFRFHQSFPLCHNMQHSIVCHLCTLSLNNYYVSPAMKQKIHASLMHVSSNIITPMTVPNTTERLYLLHTLTMTCHLIRHDKLTSKVAKTAVAVMSSSSSSSCRQNGRIMALYLGLIPYLPGSETFGKFYLLRGLINALDKRRKSAVEEQQQQGKGGGGGDDVVEDVVMRYAQVLGAIRAFRRQLLVKKVTSTTPDDVEELHRFTTIVLHHVVELLTEMKQKKTLSLSVILTVVEGMLMTLDFDDEGNVMFVGRLLELAGQLLSDNNGRSSNEEEWGREDEERRMMTMTVDEEEGWLLRTKAYYRKLVGEGHWGRVQV